MLNLPKPIADYFSADRGDAEAVAQCFTENAVEDEGRTYNGRIEIARWKTEASTKYQYTCEPIAIAETEGKIVVTGHLVGDFPGSPVDLRYFFELENGKIAALETAL
ncbi:nuclear transport factor 2 family protein [Pseudomonas aeruginosa]|uniref:nuclear transport factor 2 family protein n=1 Tax=Pseudomonas aeruginosa TaxID=287 RepID=UPI0031B6D3F7